MKHLPKILFLALLCIACHDEHDVPTHDFTIGFKAGVENTRAVVTDTEPLKDGFSVWGGFDGTTVFDGRKVYWGTDSEGNTGWMYDNPEVWVLNKNYTFFAVYPLQNQDKVVPFIEGNALAYKLSFEVPSTADTDLLTASNSVNTNDTPPATVALNFTHTLTRVNINIQKNGANAEDEVIVRAISINNLKKSGIYNNHTNQWEETVDGMNFTTLNDLNVELGLDDTGNPTPTSVIKDLLLIPQQIAENSIQISITYSLQTDNTIDYYTVNAYLPSTEWQKQTIYTYNISLGEQNNSILFGIPSVQDWKREEQIGGSIIIQ